MKRTVLNAVVIAALIGQLIPLQTVFANPTSISSRAARQLDILRDDSSVVIGESSETGKVTFIGSSDGNPISNGVMSFMPFVGGNDPNSAALDQYAPMFGINDYNAELTLESSVQADKDRTTSRYQQLYQGIPVMAGEITLNTSSSGGLYAMMGEASPDLSVETTPQIDSAEASRQAIELMTSRYSVAAADVSLTTPALWIYDPRLLESSSMPAELVWRLEARSVTDRSLDVLILVNAIHGGISLQFNQIDTEINNGTWQKRSLAQEGPTTEVPVTETTEPPTDTPTETTTETVTETVTETPLPTETPTIMPTETLMEVPTPQANAINGVTIAVYTMNHLTEDDGASLPGTFVCNDTTPNCTSGSDADADHALTYSIDTYNYYYNNFARNSLNNSGLNITLSVHYDLNYANAYWNGSQVVFGDYFTTDDIVAHELTHGVTQYTSNLYYYYQSGAINESLSDVFGEFVDQTNGKGTDTAGVKWLMGEDYGAFRSMSNPPTYSDPDKMTSSLYHHGDLENLSSVSFDNGGVHTNSGINNKAAYLMTDGGTFNGYTITGLGIPKVAAIYYEVETHLLTSGSNYKDLYYALHQACVNVIGGSAGVTLQDCGEVQKAVDAVEMNKDPLTNFTPQAQVCPANTQPSNLFFDDFESSNSKWTLSDYVTTNWGRTIGYASDGTLSMYAGDASSVSDARLSMASGVTVPASGTTYLYFDHVFGLEKDYTTGYAYDGAVLEYKIDSGSWQDASSLFDSGQNYNGTIYSPSTGPNPLAGQSGFISDSHGYVSTRYNLSTSSIKGHAVNFRWRVGTDSTVGDLGWLIDNVRIYQCQSDVTGSLIFSDNFSTDHQWTDATSGSVTRDTTNALLNFTSNESTALHFSIPIHATNAPIELNFRYKVNSTSGSSMLWVGLAVDSTDLTSVSAADRAGTYIGIDSNNKIQFMNLYPNGTSNQVNSASSTLAYGGTQVWRNATLIVNGTSWSISVKDDNGSTIGTLSGSLTSQQAQYNFLTLMYDNGGGSNSIAGQLDDFYVYGTEQTSTFGDVPYSYTETLGGVTYQLHDYVQALYNAGLTAGTSTDPLLLYSPTLNLDRSMAAVFILRANYGTGYAPPAAPWTTFVNESWANNAYAQKWAEGLYQAHLTAGCQASPLKYCPDNTLARVEGVVFALHMKYDYFDGDSNLVSYVPPAATGTVFADLTDTSYWGTKWAEKAYADGLLPSCGTSGGKPLFCPLDPVDRAWAAYMIVKAKALALP